MKIKRIISTALALVMALGVLTVIPHETEAATVTPLSAGKVDLKGNTVINYSGKSSSDVFESREAKLATMMKIKEESGIVIYYEAYTGEVAFENTKTGDILFTNPYDLSGSYFSESEATKKQLLSQIHLTYLDNGEEKEMWSFEEAAERQQITMVDIKNGIRVEYKIGEPAIQRLTPRMISKERFNKFIQEPIEEILRQIDEGTYQDGKYNPKDFDIAFAWTKFLSFYELKDTDAPGLSERAIKEMETAFPIVKQFPVYVCETKISAHELEILETLVKKCCPKYTYEELDFDNQQCGFKNTDQVPPRFAMALEYTINEEGVVDVTLPANGISFDETIYQLQDVSILPFMGSGSNEFEGYTFLPDGSGTIFRYEDLKDTIYTVSGQVYGADFAYHEIETGQNAQALRFPVFGAVTNFTTPADGSKPEQDYNDSGFLAVITEGDSLATLTTDHGGALHPYNSVYATFTPRPSDTYELMTGASESGATFTVTSSRRFTGSYKIKYIMLSSEDKYEPTYFGMAEAYRDYLNKAGVLEKKTESKETIPLYIESFGSTTGTKRVLSFPVTVDIPLTTFDDIQTMTNELAEMGITNVGYKLTGFANGGLDSTAPIKLKWQSSLGGSDGLESLVSFAADKGIGLYPEFDFAYINSRDTFDGVDLKAHAVKTIDGRYIRKQVYDSGFQEFVSVGGAAISASVFDEYWDDFSGRFQDYNIGGISLSTLGTDLNSDFDDDDPHHREDTKEYTADMLQSVADANKVMISGGNAYALKYADIITDVSLTSSEYIRASQTVPFTGIVLHGSVDFTGTPINMEGDIDEAILNAIENGAGLFFTLSYQNTKELAADEFWSKYYSVSYDIWKNDVKEYYDILNGAMKDVQTSYITDHKFIDAIRDLDEDEIAADSAIYDAYEAEIRAAVEAAEERYQLAVARAERLGTAAPDRNKFKPELPKALDQSGEIATYTRMYVEFCQGKITAEELGARPQMTSKYQTQTGSVVYVEYGDSVAFVLNYNSYPVRVQLGEAEAVVVEAGGFATVAANS